LVKGGILTQTAACTTTCFSTPAPTRELAGGLHFEAKAASNTFKDFAGAMPPLANQKALRNSPNLIFHRQ
jgi:hypothetical protein